MEEGNQSGVGVYALVNDEGVVINTIVWDGDGDGWSPPPGQVPVLVKESDGPVSIGWLCEGGRFAEPS